jgi:hypothetical protein
MSFSPNLFLANIKAKGGPAKSSRFQVIIPIPQYLSLRFGNNFLSNLLNFPNEVIGAIARGESNAPPFGDDKKGSDQSFSWRNDATRWLALQCEATEIPGKSYSTTDVKTYGPTFKVPNQTVYNDISLTFICNNEFSERKLFDAWLETIRSPITNNFRFAKSEGGSGYMTQLKIIQYDDFVKQIYSVELMDAYPTGISSQQLSWSDDSLHRLTVQFSYHKYRTIYDGKLDGNEITAAIGGSLGARAIGEVQNAVTGFFNR